MYISGSVQRVQSNWLGWQACVCGASCQVAGGEQFYVHTISLVYRVLCLLQASKYSKRQAFVLPGDINKLLRIKACSVSVYLTHNHASQIKGDNMHVSASAS